MKKFVSLNVLILLIFFTIFSEVFAQDNIVLEGSGATFPQILYRKWFEVYKNRKGIRVNYTGLGSGGGIRQLLEKKVDFGATDAFLSDAEMKKSENKILHIPTCLGAVAVIYNLPGKPQLRFTPRILAGIFMGEITNWRDQRIVAVNPDVRLPDLEIKVVHRSESSGTTYLFTDYLTKVSDSWRQKAKRGKLIEWPAGIGVEGNGGIAQFVQKISGAVGYVELSYAIKNKFPMAMIKNRSGKFIKASLESVSKAAEVELPLDCRILITDTSIADGYPISAFTYLIFYREQAYQRRSEARAKELVELLRWCILKGQIYNRGLHYAPLPATAVEKAEKIISSITYQGEKLSK